MTDKELDALVALTEEFVTTTWHLLDNSEMSGPKDDPIITVWQPNFDEVSALLDRCEGLPSGSTEHMTAGELLASNMRAAIATLRNKLAEAQADVDKGAMDYCALMGRYDAEKVRADRAEAELAAVNEHRRIKPIDTAPEDIAILVAPEHASADDWQVSWWMTDEHRWANWNRSTLPYEWAPMPARIGDHDHITVCQTK